MAKFDIQLGTIEAGPIRDAFEIIQQYLEDQEVESLFGQDIKTRILEGELGSFEQVNHEMPGQIFATIGYTEISPTGSFPFKRWRVMEYLGSSSCGFLTSLKDTRVTIWGNHTTDKLKYRVIVFYR